jgi:GNAT superfamily N-acetyltransferase
VAQSLIRFTSVVDRQVARIASHCVQKTVRRDRRQFIAVSCHYDIVEWLQPDWLYEPHLGAFEWRSLQRRPEIAVEIRSVSKSIWPQFSKYHYLTSRLSPQAVCIGGFIEGRCVVFTSSVRFVHPVAKNLHQAHRTVVLPDYQGLGLGGRLSDWLGEFLWRHGWRLNATIAHPALIAYRRASPRWRVLRSGFQSLKGHGPKADRDMGRHQLVFSSRRVSTSFAFTPPAGTPSPARPMPLDDLKVD